MRLPYINPREANIRRDHSHVHRPPDADDQKSDLYRRNQGTLLRLPGGPAGCILYYGGQFHGTETLLRFKSQDRRNIRLIIVAYL